MAAGEGILHPRIRALQRQRRSELASQGHKIAFYDVPLLFEKNLEADFNATVVVLCDAETQMKRLLARDGMTEVDARKRVAAQLALSEKKARADHVLRNDGTVEDLRKATLALLRKL
jgi:dephospho-CoA kinase